MAYVIVNGEVVSTFYNGQGAKIVEKFTKRDGTEGASYYSAFFTEPHGLEVGDSGVFKGNISVSLRTWTDDQGLERQSADATINNTKAEEVVSGEGAVPEPAGAKGF